MKSRCLLLLISCALWLPACAHRERRPERRPEAPRVQKPRADPSEGWIHGKLTRSSDGATLSFRIEKKMVRFGRARGGVAALGDPDGEIFRGTYDGVMESGRTGFGQIQDTHGRPLGSVRTYEHSNNANAIATLTGSNVTIILLSMQILAGMSPHGIGTGSDNKGRQYQVQF